MWLLQHHSNWRQYKNAAFTTVYEKYEFLRASFRIHVAPHCFALMIIEILKGLDFCIAYLDNVTIYSKTEEQCLDHIRHVFNQLWTVNINLKLTKCYFFKAKIQYPLLSQDGVSPFPENWMQFYAQTSKHKRIETIPWPDRFLQKSH